jgi:hypothetical protein
MVIVLDAPSLNFSVHKGISGSPATYGFRKNTFANPKGKRKKGSNQGNGAEGERPYPRNRKGLPTNPSDRIKHVFTVPSQG